MQFTIFNLLFWLCLCFTFELSRAICKEGERKNQIILFLMVFLVLDCKSVCVAERGFKPQPRSFQHVVHSFLQHNVFNLTYVMHFHNDQPTDTTVLSPDCIFHSMHFHTLFTLYIRGSYYRKQNILKQNDRK